MQMRMCASSVLQSHRTSLHKDAPRVLDRALCGGLVATQHRVHVPDINVLDIAVSKIAQDQSTLDQHTHTVCSFCGKCGKGTVGRHHGCAVLYMTAGAAARMFPDVAAVETSRGCSWKGRTLACNICWPEVSEAQPIQDCLRTTKIVPEVESIG